MYTPNVGKYSGVLAIAMLLNRVVSRHLHLVPVVHMALSAQSLL